MRVGGRRMGPIACAVALSLAPLVVAGTPAGRQPVLDQVTLPHGYYWRERHFVYVRTADMRPCACDVNRDVKLHANLAHERGT